MKYILSCCYFLVVFFGYVSCCSACDISIFLPEYKRLHRIAKIGETNAGISGGGFAILDCVKLYEDQRAFECLTKILEIGLNDELAFYAVQCIEKREFKETSMAEQLAELKSIKKAKEIMLRKSRERERIAGVYFSAFPDKKSSWRYSDPFWIYHNFFESDSIEKLQEIHYLLAKEGIIHCYMGFFEKNPKSCMRDWIVNERFLNEFWDNLNLRKLEIVPCFDNRRYDLLKCILFEKEKPSASKLLQLHKNYLQEYSILEPFLPKILENAKIGDELCMETLCFLVRDSLTDYPMFREHKTFGEFIEKIENDESLMLQLTDYFKNNTMLDAQHIEDMTWKYRIEKK